MALAELLAGLSEDPVPYERAQKGISRGQEEGELLSSPLALCDVSSQRRMVDGERMVEAVAQAEVPEGLRKSSPMFCPEFEERSPLLWPTMGNCYLLVRAVPPYKSGGKITLTLQERRYREQKSRTKKGK